MTRRPLHTIRLAMLALILCASISSEAATLTAIPVQVRQMVQNYVVRPTKKTYKTVTSKIWGAGRFIRGMYGVRGFGTPLTQRDMSTGRNLRNNPPDYIGANAVIGTKTTVDKGYNAARINAQAMVNRLKLKNLLPWKVQ